MTFLKFNQNKKKIKLSLKTTYNRVRELNE